MMMVMMISMLMLLLMMMMIYFFDMITNMLDTPAADQVDNGDKSM